MAGTSDREVDPGNNPKKNYNNKQRDYTSKYPFFSYFHTICP
jgi:hypothetical protein